MDGYVKITSRDWSMDGYVEITSKNRRVKIKSKDGIGV